jgi:hypothetical protein
MKYLLLIALLVAPVCGAAYKGKNIDGKKYPCEAKSEKGIYSGSVVFEGKTAVVYLEDKAVELKLENESIEDPAKIYAYNEQGSWTISISF